MRPSAVTRRAAHQGALQDLASAGGSVISTHLYQFRTLQMKTIYTALTGFLVALAAGAWAQGAGPTDPQIAAIVVTANQVDIDAGTLAKSKSHSNDVKQFAQLMITDHGGVNKSATELVQKLHVTPESNATSESLQQGGDQNLAALMKLKDGAFDRAYIDHEVTYHQSVIEALDKTLIPGARNEELKALLVKVRPAFVAHLEHAKQLQASLGKRGECSPSHESGAGNSWRGCAGLSSSA